MSNDARLSTGLPGHPKTKKLIRRLGPSAGWSLVCLILWARDHRPDGDLSGLSTEDLELAVDWTGENDAFVAALAAVGFIDGEEGAYRLHDWEEHQPWSTGSEARSETARWKSLCRHYGRNGAAERMPEYAAKLASSTDSDAGSKKPDAGSKGAALLQDAGSNKTLPPSPNPSPNPSPRAVDQEPPIPPSGGQAGKDAPAKRSRKPAEGMTYDAFVALCKAESEKLIPADHTVFAFAEDAGIPVDFIKIAWREFARQYRGSRTTQAGKRGWRQKFENCVRRNWFKLWWPSPEGIALTTTGMLLKREIEAEDARREEARHEDRAA